LTGSELEAPLDANPDELAISHHISDGALIIEVAGEIDLHTATELQRAVDRLSPFPHPVTLDLSGVGFIDSTGIRALLAINNRATETTGEAVRIVNPTDSTRRLLELTGIDKILNLQGAAEA
jgi:anti-sigma B factor antagonist